MKLELDGWVNISTFGNSADIYAKGRRRVLVDKNSGEVICRYVVVKKADEGGNPLSVGKQNKA